MNSIITLKRLIELLSKTSGASAEQSDAFIKAFTSLIRDTLAQGEEVSIKDIGRFSVTAGKKVEFTPEKELAEAINAPFSMFAPEEIAPDLTVEDIARAAKAATLEAAEPASEQAEEKPAEAPVEEAKPIEPTPSEPEQAEPEQAEPTPVAATPSEPEPVEPERSEPKPVEPKPIEPKQVEVKPIEPKPVEPKPIESKPTEPTPPAMIAAEKPCPIGPEPTSTQSKRQEQAPARKAPVAPKIEYRANGVGSDEPEKRRSSALWMIWAAIFGLLIGIAIGYFLHDPITNLIEPSAIPTEQPTEGQDSALIAEEVAVEAAAVAETDSMAAKTTSADKIAAPAPKAETAAATQSIEKWDTIRAGNSLGTMAKKHYGNNVYWVYIYLENESQIPNPNRISAGTRLKIPPLSKYATAATEEENKAAAQKKVNQILSKYPQ